MPIGPESPMAAPSLVQRRSSSKAEFSRSFAAAETFANIRSLLPHCYGLVSTASLKYALRETLLLALVRLFQAIPSIAPLALRPSHWALHTSSTTRRNISYLSEPSSAFFRKIEIGRANV